MFLLLTSSMTPVSALARRQSITSQVIKAKMAKPIGTACSAKRRGCEAFHASGGTRGA